jgi:SAM-dependent methyltransferase
MENISCPLCQSTVSQVVYRGLPDRMYSHPGETTTLIKCSNCQLIYQNPRPTLQEIGAYYPENYEPYQDVIADHRSSWLLIKAYNYGYQKRMSAVTTWKKGGCLLDIGCASGGFLNYAQSSYRWVTKGVEISGTAAAYARDHNHLDVFSGTLEEANYPAGSFDAVTMWDVLEHVHDPLNTLTEIYRVLKPGGIVVSRVPNGGSWDAHLFGEFWAGLDAPRHLFVFTHQSLSALVEKAGFNILALNTSGGNYPAFVLSLRFYLSEKLHDPQLAASEKTWINFLYSPAARLLAAPFFSIPGIFNAGPLSTITAVKPSQGPHP